MPSYCAVGCSNRKEGGLNLYLQISSKLKERVDMEKQSQLSGVGTNFELIFLSGMWYKSPHTAPKNINTEKISYLIGINRLIPYAILWFLCSFFICVRF